MACRRAENVWTVQNMNTGKKSCTTEGPHVVALLFPLGAISAVAPGDGMCRNYLQDREERAKDSRMSECEISHCFYFASAVGAWKNAGLANACGDDPHSMHADHLDQFARNSMHPAVYQDPDDPPIHNCGSSMTPCHLHLPELFVCARYSAAICDMILRTVAWVAHAWWTCICQRCTGQSTVECLQLAMSKPPLSHPWGVPTRPSQLSSLTTSRNLCVS